MLRILFLLLSSPLLLSFILTPPKAPVQNSSLIIAAHLEPSLFSTLDLSCRNTLSLSCLHSVNRYGSPTMCQLCHKFWAHDGEPGIALTGLMHGWCPPRSPHIQHTRRSVLGCSITTSRTLLLSPYPDLKLVSKTTFIHLFIHPSLLCFSRRPGNTGDVKDTSKMNS